MSSTPFVSSPAGSFNVSPPFTYSVAGPPAPSSKSPSTNSTIAISVMVCVAAFILFALLKFYSMYTTSAESERDQRIGVRRPGTERAVKKALDAHMIAAIPERPYGDAEVETECAVCLGDYEVDEAVKQLPPCKHLFHSECINSWLSVRHTCPICRVSLLPDDASGEEKEQQEVPSPVTASEPERADQAAQEDARQAAASGGADALAADGHPEHAAVGQVDQAELGDGHAQRAMRRSPSVNVENAMRRSVSVRMPAEVVERLRAMGDMDDDELLSVFRQARSRSEGLGNGSLAAAAACGVRGASSSLPRLGSGRSSRSSLSSGLRSLSVGRSEWVTIEMGAADGPDSRVSHAISGLPEGPDKQAGGQAAPPPPHGAAQGFVAEGQKAIGQTVNSITSAVRWLSKRTGTSGASEQAAGSGADAVAASESASHPATGPNAV